MGADDGLVFIRIVETLRVLEVRDIDGCNVVAECQSKVGPFAILGDIRVDGDGILGFVSEVDEKLGSPLLALRVLSERLCCVSDGGMFSP